MDAAAKEKAEKDSAKLLNELVLMGFQKEQAKKAMAKSKSSVLNDLIDIIIKDMSDMGASHVAATAEKPIAAIYIAYSCEVCTFINENNPGPTCSVCGSAAPTHALKVSVAPTEAPKTMPENPDATDQALNVFGSDVAKEGSEEKDARTRAAELEIAEELKRAKLQDQMREVKSYYATSHVVDYFFATNMSGKSSKPLVAGAATFNEEKGALDLHFVQFKYRKSYMKSVTGNAAKVD